MGKGNFRYDIAVTAEYKGNRKDVEKPQHLEAIRKHMIKNWEAIVSKGEEADDLIGIAATEGGKESIVVSIDKDMVRFLVVTTTRTRKSSPLCLTSMA